MNGVERVEFRHKTFQYLKTVSYSLDALASKLNIARPTLSDKLLGKRLLTHSEIKQIILVLAEWDAITLQSQALELLALLNCPNFNAQEWETEPLKKLEANTPGAKTGSPSPPSSILTLPAPITPLIGREQELATLETMLSRNKIRLVTLTGPGGIGKTRLAQQVARNMLNQVEHGVFFVELATISEPDFVISAISKVLNLKESGKPTLLDSLKNFLAEKQLLLVLDNFEQVLDAAPLIGDLLIAAPRLKVLVTSRAVLHLYGEYEYIVPSLAVPDLKHLPEINIVTQQAAVELFIERAQAVKADFELSETNVQDVVGICARLDGLPLAIELVASRSKIYGPQALLKDKSLKLASGGAVNLPPRHRSLQNAIEWSYELLTMQEKKLFAQLGVFAGGWALESAFLVIGESPIETLLEDLISLADKSLIVKSEGLEGQPRFTMLQTIREYALECLEKFGDTKILKKQYATYFLDLSEKAESHLTGSDQTFWMNCLEQEMGNIRSVLGWTIEKEEINSALRLSGALGRFWAAKAYFSEGRHWLELSLKKAIEFTSSTVELLPTAKALQMTALLALRQGDYSQAYAAYSKSLAIYEKLDSKQGIADVLKGMGVLAHYQANFEEAFEYYHKSLEVYRECGNKQGIADVLNNLAIIMDAKGEAEKADQLLEESLILRREIGNKRDIADSLNNIGTRAKDQMDYERAKSLLEESLLIYREIGYLQGIPLPLINLAALFSNAEEYDEAKSLYLEVINILKEQGSKQYLNFALCGLAEILYREKSFDESIQLFKDAIALSRNIGATAELINALSSLAHVLAEQDCLAEAKELQGESLALSKAADLYVEIAQNFEGFAEIAFKENQYGKAMILYGAASVMRESCNTPLGKASLKEETIIKNAMFCAIGKEAYEKAWNKGRDLTIEQAILYTCEEGRS
jgi:predicted ATPase/Tfp pilus assembly protein PilF